jgi:hypothetical protein
MTTKSITCSWCHELNRVTPGPTSCSNCGHRADLPRMSCDCPACKAGRPELTNKARYTSAVGQVEQAAAALRNAVALLTPDALGELIEFGPLADELAVEVAGLANMLAARARTS